ncbi:unannotated protein [freshwater metagenome]|uniref:Unannotated protein n=1 Tax=freshwater metagenome TaxID=449393 RepID=A0A6J7BZS9_9ZZZZ
MLALLELDLGGRTRLDDGHAASELGKALLELLAVVVRVGLLDLGADLVHATRDLVRVTRTFDDRGLVLGDDDLAGATEELEAHRVELEADLFGDDLATGEDGDVLEHRLATVSEAGSLDGDRAERPADLVDDECGECLALDVLSDDRQRLAGGHDLLEDRKEVLHTGDLGVHDEDVSILKHGLHALGVGDEVARDVALVEAHAFGELELETEGVALLDGDDTFLADLVHGLGDDLADLGVSGADRCRGSDLLLGLNLFGHLEQLCAHSLNGLLDTALERHRVRAGCDVAQSLANERLCEHGGGGGAVSGDVVGLLRDLLDELGPDLLVRVLELDLLRDGDAVVGDRGGSPLLLQNDVAALRAEGDLDRVGEGVHAPLERATGGLVERNDLRHVAADPFRKCGMDLVGARDGRSTCGALFALHLDLTSRGLDCHPIRQRQPCRLSLT